LDKIINKNMKKITLNLLAQFLCLIAFAQVELNKNLVLHFPFSNNYTDASTFGSTAVKFNGGPAFGFDRKSQASSSLVFNGNGSLRLTANNNCLNFGTGSSYTMSFWFRTNDQSSQTFFYNVNTTSSKGITLTLNEYLKGELYFLVRGSSENDWLHLKYKDVNLLDNKWHHLLIIVNQTNKAAGIFIDGEFKNGVSFTGKNPDPSPVDKTKIYVGDGYTGDFDELRFYSRTLSQAEIDELAGLTNTSIKNSLSNIKLNIQNPVNENLNVSFETPIALNYIKIYALNGTEILSFNLSNDISNTQFVLPLGSQLNKGLYIIEVQDKMLNTHRSKIIVSN